MIADFRFQISDLARTHISHGRECVNLKSEI